MEYQGEANSGYIKLLISYLKLLGIQITSSDLENITVKLQIYMTYTALFTLKHI